MASPFGKSSALKLLDGNPGKRPISKDEPKAEAGIPVMPLWLEPFAIAVKEWKRETQVLFKMGVLTLADGPLLANRVYLTHLVQTLAWDVNREGSTVETYVIDKQGVSYLSSMKTNPKMLQLQNAIKEHRMIGYMLGLDPSSRTRLHTGKSSEDDEFENFNKR